MWKQLVSPNTSVKEHAYWCLSLVRKVFRQPAVEPTAWVGWQKTKHKHTSRTLPSVAVPVWFSWWGTVDGVYQNWGHVVAYIPGKGFLSSPTSGYGQLWFKSIADVERSLGMKFVGWSEDISGGRVAQYVKQKKSNDAIAREVIAGKWGNGLIRKTRLKAAGYNPTTIQSLVNKILKPKAPAKQVRLTVRKNEGLSHLAKRAGYKDFGSAKRWQAITNLNKKVSWQTFNKSLKVGQSVRVK